MSDNTISNILHAGYILLMWGGLVGVVAIGPQTVVLLGAVALLCSVGVVEILTLAVAAIHGNGYRIDMHSVVTVIAGGYVVANYLI